MATGVIFQTVFVIFMLAITGGTAFAGTSQLSDDDVSGETSSLSEKWGLDSHSIRLTAAGYMLDFRYSVTDPAKAGHLINHHIKPYLIDEASGARMIVPAPPKLGAMRNSGNDLKVGPTYFIIFANPGRFIKKGNKVTVALGDVHIEHLVVQ